VVSGNISHHEHPAPRHPCQMLSVNRLLVGTTSSPRTLLSMYWDTSIGLLKTATERHVLLLIAAMVVVVSRNRMSQIAAALLGMAAVYRSVARIHTDLGLLGGTANLPRYSITIHTIALAALAMAVTSLVLSRFSRRCVPSLCRDTWRGWVVMGLVFFTPIMHGFGTGNPLYMMIVNGFAAWMAMIIAILTGLDRAAQVARGFAGMVAVAAAMASVLIAKSGLTEYPYRTHAYAETTMVAEGIPALSSVKLRADVAAEFSAVHKALTRTLEPKGRAMVGFDRMAGILLMLDGRPVGETWASEIDRERTAEGFRASCYKGKPWWSSRWPVFIFGRAVTTTELRAFEYCGIDFAKDYRSLAPPAQTAGLAIFVPAKEQHDLGSE
jgi:hypothetical protein